MIVLASTSAIRRQLLKQAGVDFRPARPPVDEDTITHALRQAGATAAQVAANLAAGKATSVALIQPHAHVIGVDQMMECDGRWYDKPTDRATAREQLQSLRGKTHRLISAAVICFEGRLTWTHADSAELTMRNFSDHYLDDYLDQTGDSVHASVGGYQLEGLGVQLFESIKGDYFTILGLPLLPLLAALRQARAIPE